MGQERAPLVEAIRRYHADGTARFHMPGHKGGRAGGGTLRRALGRAPFAFDVTGVPGLDDLHEPSGVIAEAQCLAARAFGADQTYFLVNGTSAGVVAMIVAACMPGQKIIIGRNMHKSALAGIILCGGHPVYVAPVVDDGLGIAHGVRPQDVAAALGAHPDAAAVALVSPTYYGAVSDLAAIAALAHARGKPVLVDEAHGAHFYFSRRLPAGALDAGCDAVAHGMHKVLGAFTQASALHVVGDRVDRSRVKKALQLIQSTSASYLLLGSIDAARRDAVRRGAAMAARALGLAAALRDGVRRLGRLGRLKTFGAERVGEPGVFALDPTKVTVSVRGLGILGPDAEAFLRRRHRIQVEMSDLFNVLFMVSGANRAAEVRRVLRGLGDLARRPPSSTNSFSGHFVANGAPAAPPIPPLAALPREAFFRPAAAVALEQARGRVCAEAVTCYPPGIPVVCPGEVLTPEIVEYLSLIRRTGLRISGPADRTLGTLRVL